MVGHTTLHTFCWWCFWLQHATAARCINGISSSILPETIVAETSFILLRDSQSSSPGEGQKGGAQVKLLPQSWDKARPYGEGTSTVS